MDNKFEFILQRLLGGQHPYSLVKPLPDFNDNYHNLVEENLNKAFILALGGDSKAQNCAREYLEQQAANAELNNSVQAIAKFYLLGLQKILAEVNSKTKEIPEINLALTTLADLLSNFY